MAEDRRVRKTQNAIKHAFIQLLNEKDLDKITISDITHKADINRGTFYLHY
ncbi:TetR/AcrR family transcriptional regulator, partial [Staphylococcus cohnii]